MKALSVVVPPLKAAIVLAPVGLLGVLAGVPWLFPSLGPSVVTQVGSPDKPEARASHVLAGHLLGMAGAYVAVFLSAGAQRLVGKRHAPAESTTLLVALGSMEPTLRTAVTIVAGVVLVTVLGEAARRLALARDGREAAESRDGPR